VSEPTLEVTEQIDTTLEPQPVQDPIEENSVTVLDPVELFKEEPTQQAVE